MRVFNPDICAKTIDQLSEDLTNEMQMLITVIKPFAYSRSDAQQGHLALVLARAERAASQLKVLCGSVGDEALDDEKIASHKRASYVQDVDYTYLVAQVEEADDLFVKAHKLLRKPLTVERVEGNVVHLGADPEAAEVQRIDCMLKALEIEKLLGEDSLSNGCSAETAEATKVEATAAAKAETKAETTDKCGRARPILRLV